MTDQNDEIVRVYTLIVEALQRRITEYEIKMDGFINALDRLENLEKCFFKIPNHKQKLQKEIASEFGWDEWKIANTALTIKQMEQILERIKR